MAVKFLSSKYSGNNHGYINLPQYRFNYKKEGYVAIRGQVGAALVIFVNGNNKTEFRVRNENDLNAISDFLSKHFGEYLGFSNEDEVATLTNADLMKKIDSSETKPKQIEVETRGFVRNVYVAEYIKRRAQGICDLCDEAAPFSNAAGKPYLECHHIEWLSNGGSDTIQNAVALCPNCHRRMHILKEHEDINRLKEKAKRILT